MSLKKWAHLTLAVMVGFIVVKLATKHLPLPAPVKNAIAMA